MEGFSEDGYETAALREEVTKGRQMGKTDQGSEPLNRDNGGGKNI